MHRKHTTTACQICRESKTKCDGVKPTCGSCAKKRKSCVYSEGNDKRKISLRTATEVLLGRVDQLTRSIISAGLDIPPLGAYEQSVIDEASAIFGAPQVPFPSSKQLETSTIPAQVSNPLNTDNTVQDLTSYGDTLTNGTLTANEQTVNQSLAFDFQAWTDFPSIEQWDGSPTDWPWYILNDCSNIVPEFDVIPRAQPAIDQSVTTSHLRADNLVEAPESGTTSEDEVETELIPHLAARLGSLRLGADGRLHYYGTASNLHLLGTTSSLIPDIDVHEKYQEASMALENADLDQDVPADLEEHLIEQYFCWNNPCHSTVNRDAFEKERAEGKSAQGIYCSPALKAAICAVAATYEEPYHRTFITFPKPMAEFFADKSKLLLEFEIDRPCVSTVQTLVLLVFHEAAANRDTRAWLYGGMAMRLSFDLGLHVDSYPYVAQGILTTLDAEARQGAFWSCMVVNHLWSFTLGRPFRIDSEELTVKKPVGSTLLLLVQQQWVSFCEDLAPLIRVLYGCTRISKLALQNLCHQTASRLLVWPTKIPDEIKVREDDSTSHHVLFLHMAYHNFRILVHRPWTSRGSQPQGQVGPGFRHARDICRDSASEIASLLRRYETLYGFKRMHVYASTIIFSASLILICGLIAEDLLAERQDQNAKADVLGDLNTCFRALDELGQSFECAKRNRQQLLEIQRHWTRRKKEAKTSVKRLSGNDNLGKEVARKRSKLSQN